MSRQAATTVTYKRAIPLYQENKPDPFGNSGKWELLNKILYLYRWSWHFLWATKELPNKDRKTYF